MRIVLIILILILIKIEIYAQHLSLYEAIHLALKNNKTILYAADQNFLSANARLNSAEAVYNPILNAQATYSRSLTKTQTLVTANEILYQVKSYQQIYPSLSLEKTFLTPLGSKITLTGGLQTVVSGISSLSYQTSPTLGFIYQQPLSASGIESGHIDIELAKQTFQQAEINYELQKEELALSVIQSYFQLWQTERDVEQSVRDKESAKRILDIAEMKLKHGSIAEFEVLNLRVQCNLADDNLLQSENNLKTQKISFLRILGANIDSTVTLSQNIIVDSINFSLKYAIEQAIKNRLEIKQSEITLAGIRLSLNQTESTTSPILQFNASYNFNSNYETAFINSFNLPNYGWNLQSTISIPVFDGGQISSLVEISKRNISMQEESIKLMKEDIAIDIETRYRTLMLDIKRMSSLQLILKAASEAMNIAELRFNSGEITSTEIENVRNRYNTSRNSLDGAKISYIIERAGLAKAMGILFNWIEELK